MMTRWLARSALGLIILVLAALPFAFNGRGSGTVSATHDGTGEHIAQMSIDLDEAGNGTTTVVDRNADTVVDAEGTVEGVCGNNGTGDGQDDDGDTVVDDGCPAGGPAANGTPETGLCGNGVDDDPYDPPGPAGATFDGAADDGCQVPLSTQQTCIEIINDGILNADEDSDVDLASIDVTVGNQPGPGDGVPASRPMTAWQFNLDWDVDVLDVLLSDSGFLIHAAGSRSPFTDIQDQSPADTPFVHAVSDSGPADSGPGVLARLLIEGNAAGLANLSLSNTSVRDSGNVGIPIDSITGNAPVPSVLLAVSSDTDGNTTIDPSETFGCPEPADLAVVSVTTTAPAGATAGSAFNVDVSADVQNNGTAPSINANVAIQLNLPSDCTTGTNPQNTPVTLAFPAAPTTVPATFSVTCTSSSNHAFTGTATISSPGAIGDNPANNTMTSAPGATAVTSTADPSVSSVTVTGPAAPVAGTPFNLDVAVALANAGPDPATVDVDVTLTLPAGCTTSTTNPQTVSNVAVPLAGATATATFAVTCTASGSHNFSADAALVLPVLHFNDTNPNNNTGTGNATIVVADAADLKVISVTVTVPPNSSVGAAGAFDVTADIIVHNNGPTATVDADVSTDLVLPPDCTTADPNPVLDAGPLDISTSITIPQLWSVTCTQPSNHDFTVNSSIALAAGQPNVLDPNAANDTGTGQAPTATATVADLKVASVTLTAPASANPNTAFSVSVDASLHNNGPFGPVNTNATIELTVPAGCTATPAGAQTAANISLPVSTATAMPKQTFSVTCTTSGAKAFSAKVTAALNIVHVSDPSPGNATATSQTLTVNVGAAGLPPTGGDGGTLPGNGLALLLLLPLGAVIAGAGLLTLRRNRRGMRF